MNIKHVFLKNKLELHYDAHLINEHPDFDDDYQILHSENKFLC